MLEEKKTCNPQKKISLLYVDDDQSFLDIGKVFLELSEEFTVTTQISAIQAQNLLQINEYDAIISDYEMPGMNGINFLKFVRKNYGEVPFILFTGRGREEVVIEALNSGANYYLQKGGDPVSQFAELTHKIHQAVRIKQAEIQLIESQKTTSDIIHFIPDPTVAVNTSGNIIAWNRAFEEITGYSAEDMIGKDYYEHAEGTYGYRSPLLLDLIDEPDEVICQHYTNIRRTGNILMAETDLIVHQGNPLSVMITACHLYDRNGNRTGSIESIRNITDLKKTEYILQQNEERYRSIIDAQSDLIIRFTRDGIITFINETGKQFFSTLFGINECTGKKIHDLLQSGLNTEIIHFLFSLNPDHPTDEIESQTTTPGGKTFWYLWKVSALFDMHNRLYEYQAVGRDITSRKQAETFVIESESRLRYFLEGSIDAIALINEEGIITEWNTSSERITGIKKSSVIGRYAWEVTCQLMPRERRNPQRLKIVEEMVRSSLITGIPFFDKSMVMDAERPDNTRIIVRQTLFTIKTTKGYQLCLISQDITSQNQAEEELRECKNLFIEMAHRSSDLIAIFDEKLTSTYISPASRSIIGYDPEELIGWDLDHTVKTIFLKSNESLYKAKEAIVKGNLFEQKEIPICRKGGEIVIINLYIIPQTRNGTFSGLQVLIQEAGK